MSPIFLVQPKARCTTLLRLWQVGIPYCGNTGGLIVSIVDAMIA